MRDYQARQNKWAKRKQEANKAINDAINNAIASKSDTTDAWAKATAVLAKYKGQYDPDTLAAVSKMPYSARLRLHLAERDPKWEAYAMQFGDEELAVQKKLEASFERVRKEIAHFYSEVRAVQRYMHRRGDDEQA